MVAAIPFANLESFRMSTPDIVAGIAMAGSSCLVVVTSLQLRRFQVPMKPEESHRERTRKQQSRYGIIHEADLIPLTTACEDSDSARDWPEPAPQSIGKQS